MEFRKNKRLFSWALGGVWVLLVGTAWGILCHYENRPGLRGPASESWPVGTRLMRDVDKESLLVFLHPKCDCSRATLAELDRLQGQFPGRFHGTAVFLLPTEEGDWSEGELPRRATAQGLEVVWDHAGEEAKRFGATTSGTIFVFQPDGTRVFAGGITPSRGHVGDNAGFSALRDWFADRRLPAAHETVFGCALFAEGATP